MISPKRFWEMTATEARASTCWAGPCDLYKVFETGPESNYEPKEGGSVVWMTGDDARAKGIVPAFVSFAPLSDKAKKHLVALGIDPAHFNYSLTTHQEAVAWAVSQGLSIPADVLAEHASVVEGVSPG